MISGLQSPSRLALVTSVGFFLAFLLAYASSLSVLVVAWSGAEAAGYSHGFLVLLCSGFLLYLKRREFARLKPAPNYWALLPLALCSLLWFAANATDIQALQMAMLPVILLCAVMLIFGYAYLRLSFVPIFILFFAIPMWQPALPLLQHITTAVTHFNLKLIGRPVFVEGNFVQVVGGTFLIEESCSGLRFLLVSVILSLINSTINRHSLKLSVILLAFITLLAFVSNWIRVLAVVLIGDYTYMQHGLVEDHANFGWGIYLVFTILPYLLISRQLEPAPASAPAEEPHSPSSSGLSIQMVRHFSAALALGFVFMLTGPVLSWWSISSESGNEISPEAPDAVTNWSLGTAGGTGASWTPDYQGPDLIIQQPYLSDSGARVNLHIVHYARQSQNAELINFNNRLADGETWIEVPGSVIELTVQSGLEGGLDVMSVRVSGRGRQSELIWYWYNVGGYNTASQYDAKLLQLSAMLQQRHDASLMAVAADCVPDCAAAELLLREFMMDMGESLLDVLTR